MQSGGDSWTSIDAASVALKRPQNALRPAYRYRLAPLSALLLPRTVVFFSRVETAIPVLAHGRFGSLSSRLSKHPVKGGFGLAEVWPIENSGVLPLESMIEQGNASMWTFPWRLLVRYAFKISFSIILKSPVRLYSDRFPAVKVEFPAYCWRFYSSCWNLRWRR